MRHVVSFVTMKRRRQQGLLGLAVCLTLATGCGEKDGAGVINPTGSCGTRPDPGRVGYGGGGATWVPDCQAPLLREYWRVDTMDGITAYTLPRMDGAPAFQPACADDTDALHELVTRYDLCAPAQSEQQVNIVNSLALADALQLTHYLHLHLQFVSDGASIAPFPITADILDACALHANTPELQALCDRERDNLEDPLGLSYSGPGAIELAARLNELYGIATN